MVEVVSVPMMWLIGLVMGGFGLFGGFHLALWKDHHKHVSHSELTYATKAELKSSIDGLRADVAEGNRIARQFMRMSIKAMQPLFQRLSIPTAIDFPELDDAG